MNRNSDPEARRNPRASHGFTLVELLVVIAIIALLAALLLPVLGQVRAAGKRTVCLNNSGQIAVAIRLYADDWADSLPVLPVPNPFPEGIGVYYKQLVKPYLGLGGPASPGEKSFACPSDRVFCTQVKFAYTSYMFNGYEAGMGAIARITGKKLGAIRSPTRAVLNGEVPAFFGGSWHPAVIRTNYPDAPDILSFVDGHAGMTKIYWNGIADSEPANYEPPAGYDYNWSGE